MKSSVLALTAVVLMCLLASGNAWFLDDNKYKGCRGIPYLEEQSICCGKSLYPRWDFDTCCGAKPYNKKKRICCDNALYMRKEKPTC